MQISQVTAALDLKLTQLDQQLKALEQERINPARSASEIDNDIDSLLKIRTKLVKSKDIAWRAHQLQSQNDDQRRARQRLIGLSLCGVSLIGAGVLLAFALNQ
jgi:hypothetical protein